MRLGIPKETIADERRVAAVPNTVSKFVAMGFEVLVEKTAGEGASISDAAFADVGAKLVSAKDALGADVVLKVRPPSKNEISQMKKGAILVALLEPYAQNHIGTDISEAGIKAFALELVPRISRAQSMDVLSSQSSLAGYRSVLEAAAIYGRSFPMMMTAAGTIPPAKVLVMGAGVAGLQAIATAKRMGAIVSATDVRPAAKEQVESLGGKFVAVEDEEFKAAETEGGYAKEMSAAYKAKQEALIAEVVANQDIVITTALIPGRAAPILVNEDMVKSMKDGAIIVDLAVEQGGNCPLSVAGEVVVKHGVHLVGYTNIQARLPEVASMLFAKNMLNFMINLWDDKEGKINIDLEDEIIAACCLPDDAPSEGAIKKKAPSKKKVTSKKKTAKKVSSKKKSSTKKKSSAEEKLEEKPSIKVEPEEKPSIKVEPEEKPSVKVEPEEKPSIKEKPEEKQGESE